MFAEGDFGVSEDAAEKTADDGGKKGDDKRDRDRLARPDLSDSRKVDGGDVKDSFGGAVADAGAPRDVAVRAVAFEKLGQKRRAAAARKRFDEEERHGLRGDADGGAERRDEGDHQVGESARAAQLGEEKYGGKIGKEG